MFRILFVCLACLIVSGFYVIVIDPLGDIAKTWPDLLGSIYYWTSIGINELSLCTEEISLAILVPDFRKNIAEQFRAIFCCKKSNGNEVQQQKPQTIPAITSIRMNNFTNGI